MTDKTIAEFRAFCDKYIDAAILKMKFNEILSHAVPVKEVEPKPAYEHPQVVPQGESVTQYLRILANVTTEPSAAALRLAADVLEDNGAWVRKTSVQVLMGVPGRIPHDTEAMTKALAEASK